MSGGQSKTFLHTVVIAYLSACLHVYMLFFCVCVFVSVCLSVFLLVYRTTGYFCDHNIFVNSCKKSRSAQIKFTDIFRPILRVPGSHCVDTCTRILYMLFVCLCGCWSVFVDC